MWACVCQSGKPTNNLDFFAKVGYSYNNITSNDSTILYKTMLY